MLSFLFVVSTLINDNCKNQMKAVFQNVSLIYRTIQYYNFTIDKITVESYQFSYIVVRLVLFRKFYWFPRKTYPMISCSIEKMFFFYSWLLVFKFFLSILTLTHAWQDDIFKQSLWVLHWICSGNETLKLFQSHFVITKSRIH